MDFDSVVTKSSHDFASKPILSYYVVLVESFDSSFEKQVSDPDEFDFSSILFNSCDTKFVPADSIFLVDLFFSSKIDIVDHKPSVLGTMDSYLVDYALTMPFVKDSRVTCVSAKVTCIRSFLLNMIPMLLFLGGRILSWIHNYKSFLQETTTSESCLEENI